MECFALLLLQKQKIMGVHLVWWSTLFRGFSFVADRSFCCRCFAATVSDCSCLLLLFRHCCCCCCCCCCHVIHYFSNQCPLLLQLACRHRFCWWYWFWTSMTNRLIIDWCCTAGSLMPLLISSLPPSAKPKSIHHCYCCCWSCGWCFWSMKIMTNQSVSGRIARRQRSCCYCCFAASASAAAIGVQHCWCRCWCRCWCCCCWSIHCYCCCCC